MASGATAVSVMVVCVRQWLRRW